MSYTQLPDWLRNKLVDVACQNLWHGNEESIEALRYLSQKRGLNEASLRKFRFGYLPIETRYKIKDIGYRFAGKIIMPICNSYGEIVALSAGRFREDDEAVKYWHESFDKSWYLYGLDIAKNQMLRKNKAIVVEGQMDTACMHQYGFDMTVGVLGSAFEKTHFALLISRCTEIYLLFDNDKSGCENLDRAMTLYRDNNWNDLGVTFIPVKLPVKGQDPDDFLRASGRIKMIELLKESKKKVEEEQEWENSLSPTKLSIY